MVQLRTGSASSAAAAAAGPDSLHINFEKDIRLHLVCGLTSDACSSASESRHLPAGHRPEPLGGAGALGGHGPLKLLGQPVMHVLAVGALHAPHAPHALRAYELHDDAAAVRLGPQAGPPVILLARVPGGLREDPVEHDLRGVGGRSCH
eukprot:CAMPEP_0179280968 /NCGR_PEP_ID=MMETSP0797-20121207/36902_1 /TAXON_ID=47934 /ORGANISM="Dinophysis acuminata, Strain DAEP01" /LENGTH=148 /DNA_ID=CAMNT_0020989643 /DNA_START=56 /DNA_END=503 /DNA_ORIENTATION=-